MVYSDICVVDNVVYIDPSTIVACGDTCSTQQVRKKVFLSPGDLETHTC